jgi:hypothetical protein
MWPMGLLLCPLPVTKLGGVHESACPLSFPDFFFQHRYRYFADFMYAGLQQTPCSVNSPGLLSLRIMILEPTSLNDPIPFLYFFFIPCLIEFRLLVLEKKILKNFQCIFTFSLLSPLGEGLSPSFE